MEVDRRIELGRQKRKVGQPLRVHHKFLRSSLMLKVSRGHLSDGFREQDKDMLVFFVRKYFCSGGSIYL